MNWFIHVCPGWQFWEVLSRSVTQKGTACKVKQKDAWGKQISKNFKMMTHHWHKDYKIWIVLTVALVTDINSFIIYGKSTFC